MGIRTYRISSLLVTCCVVTCCSKPPEKGTGTRPATAPSTAPAFVFEGPTTAPYAGPFFKDFKLALEQLPVKPEYESGQNGLSYDLFRKAQVQWEERVDIWGKACKGAKASGVWILDEVGMPGDQIIAEFHDVTRASVQFGIAVKAGPEQLDYWKRQKSRDYFTISGIVKSATVMDDKVIIELEDATFFR